MNMISIKKADLSNVKVGDKFIRMLAGVIAIPIIVGVVEDEHIWVGPVDGTFPGTKEMGWKFRRDLATEVDEDLHVDGLNKVISYLKEVID